jgi:hypothetical protein
MKLFAGLEADCFAWGNGDFSSGPRIAADAGFAWFDGKDTESAQFDTIASDEGLLHALEDGIDSSLRFGPRQTGALNNPLYKILLNHLGRRPWAVIFEDRN